MATSAAGKTPHGARPNREADESARLKPPGRSLDRASNGAARGMVVAPKPRKRRRRTEFGLRLAANFSHETHHALAVRIAARDPAARRSATSWSGASASR